MAWYCIRYQGWTVDIAQGPFRSLAEAEQAIADYVARTDQMKHDNAGSRMAAAFVRILGPFSTRREAERADMTTAAVIRSWS